MNELRKKWWTRPVGHIAWFFISAVCFTLRKRIVFANPEDKNVIGNRQCIIALWHNRTFTPCYVYRYVIHGKVPMCVFTSASKDGAMLATVAEDYGMRAARGSSGRRGVAGFRDMMREVEDGCCMCITPDGPKGPRYHCRPGIIKLASLSGLPIYPVSFEFSKFWRISKAWDGFVIPKPFSRMVMYVNTPLSVPPQLDDAAEREWCKRVEDALQYGTPDFPPPPIS